MDIVSPQRRSQNMRAIKSKDMKPEMAVRRLVHSMGYRYRLHRKDLPGKPDLVLPGKRKVIFVHGCFWHQHKDKACKIVRRPKSNKNYWNAKLERNQQRDIENQKKLVAMQWDYLIVWECQTKDLDKLSAIIKRFLD